MTRKIIVVCIIFLIIVGLSGCQEKEKKTTSALSVEERLAGSWVSSDNNTTVEFSSSGYFGILGFSNVTGMESFSGSFEVFNDTIVVNRSDGHGFIVFEFLFSEGYSGLSLNTVGSDEVKTFVKQT